MSPGLKGTKRAMKEHIDRTNAQPGRRGCHWGPASGYTTGHAWWGSDPVGSTGVREGASGAPGDPDLRVSDDDREAVAADLNQHFGVGRLDLAEFDARTGRALGARTRGDLAGLLADLPPLRPPIRERFEIRRGPAPWLWVPVALTIIVAVSVGSAFLGDHHGFFFPWFLIPIGIVVAVRFRRQGLPRWPRIASPRGEGA